MSPVKENKAALGKSGKNEGNKKKAPSRFVKVLRVIFVESWGLKIASLFFAVALWLLIVIA